MEQYVGLDVAQKITRLCVITSDGKTVWRGQCASTPEDIPGPLRPKHQDEDYMSRLPAQVTHEQLWRAIRTPPWEWDDAPRHGHQRWDDTGCYTHQVLRLGFIDLYASENIDTAVYITSEGGLCFSVVCAACADLMWPAPQGAEYHYGRLTIRGSEYPSYP